MLSKPQPQLNTAPRQPQLMLGLISLVSRIETKIKLHLITMAYTTLVLPSLVPVLFGAEQALP